MNNLIPLVVLLTPILAQHYYPAIDRTGYTISHGGATSSVNVNFQSPAQPQQDYQQEYQQDYQQSFLTDLANKQQLATNPQHSTDILTQPEQLYNVGYSINIENNSPKLSYRYPMPKTAPTAHNAHSYRQQKLLNADIITGTHKDNVEKPYEFAASNIPNYISSEQPTIEKTQVYTNAGNTNGYTWKTLSPGVEISGYTDISQEQKVQAQSFDHAAALGKSQGFDISNVVENGKTVYQPKVETPAHDINKALTEVNAKSIEAPSNYNQHVDVSTLVLDSPKQNPYHSQGFSSQFKSGELSFNSSPFKHNLLSSSNIDFDKSLFDGFYKNYNPIFYQPEITLPSPSLPKNVHINLHTSASNQYPTYNLKYQNPLQDQNMINQHYAFVQASEVNPVNNDVKPVTEQQEDNAPQHTQPQQHIAQPQQLVQSQQHVQLQLAQQQHSQQQQAQQQLQQQAQQQQAQQQQAQQQAQQQIISQALSQQPIVVQQQQFQDQKKTEHKKYMPTIPSIPANTVRYQQPIYGKNIQNIRMKSRPPPMIIIHQKY